MSTFLWDWTIGCHPSRQCIDRTSSIIRSFLRIRETRRRARKAREASGISARPSAEPAPFNRPWKVQYCTLSKRLMMARKSPQVRFGDLTLSATSTQTGELAFARVLCLVAALARAVSERAWPGWPSWPVYPSVRLSQHGHLCLVLADLELVLVFPSGDVCSRG